MVLASVKFQRDSNHAYLQVRDRIGFTLSALQEGIAGVRVIQAYGREGVEEERFGRGNRTLYDAHMRSVWVQAWYLPVIEFAALGTTGAGDRPRWPDRPQRHGHGRHDAFFVVTLSNLFEPLSQLSQLFNQLQSSGAALHKLFELLDTPVDVPRSRVPSSCPARATSWCVTCRSHTPRTIRSSATSTS